MTDDELENALLNRGKQPEGSRDDMIQELFEVEHSAYKTFTVIMCFFLS